MAGTFMNWIIASYGVDRDIALVTLERLHHLIDRYADSTGQASTTEFAPDKFAVVLAEAAQADGAAMSGQIFKSTFDAYLHFLQEQKRWTGSEQAFDALHAVVEGGPAGSEEHEELPTVSDAESFEVFNAMPLVRYARQLLAWVDAGRELTASGGLPKKELVEAAAVAGVAIRTSKQPTEATLPGLGTEGQDDLAPYAGSMKAVKRLQLIWDSLLECELIEVDKAWATQGLYARDFLDGEVSEENRDIVAEFIGAFMMSYGDWIVEHDRINGAALRGSLMQILDAALYSSRPEVFATSDVAADPSLQALCDMLEELAELGVVQIDTHYRADPAFTRSYDLFSMYVMDEQLSNVDPAKMVGMIKEVFGPGSTGNMPGLAELGETDRLELDALVPDGKSLQLRVDLEHMQPPVWRRLVVPATMSLADLHVALQVAFEWDNSHLHDFELPFAGPYGESQRFSDPDMELEETLDEWDYTLGQLVGRPKDKIYYNYDFGDSWRHKIMVEKIIDSPAGQAVRCTGGRMRAPVDDIGGIPGWYHAIEVSNDSSHEDFEHVRDMLGLSEGMLFDESDFDAKRIDAAFALQLRV
ncbi:plasmid pRiA4b ORF-3 family protein [Paeniglutamicibacter psychrophenolicus]|uniref:Plasmid pRiA4b Orf3-like domain-containing protein n=1 Tax=Paeniglutamicibacter psychrophenolicus TaxID=257454 RepID=A0ABS4WIE6_9MICC|nr:plasmid pRiA4b ORF-3 family protein [Paeniglutamicibacter psychrophenolicus]MBP2375982.1 hypothetical protein [Paeniglutamicibacter psychrophenolicus]